MKRPSDETLMAYADGKLAPDEHARVAEYLAGDADARALVEDFKRTASLAARAFADIDKTELPAGLVELILNGKADTPADAPETVVPFRKSQATEVSRPMTRWLLPMAASLSIIAGAILGYALATRTGGDIVTTAIQVGPVADGSPMRRLLESRPTGEPESLATPDGAHKEMVVVATFKDKYGRFCREVETSLAIAPGIPVDLAVACRASGGNWTVEGALHLAERQPAPSNGTGFAPASGIDEATAIDGLMNMLGAKQNLTPVEEKAALSAGWKSSQSL
ncbi:MAG: hypothetical protein KJ622_17865 [Alphaproteobacteria bacterium]|nr:hypothetical protein [Alphaproteobacteria bacterium]